MPTSPVSYTSVTLMQTACPDLGSVSAITSAQFYGYAGQAESFINAKIARLYSLPLTTTPPLLVDLATRMAIVYTMHQRQVAVQIRDIWDKNFEADLELLNAIAEGSVTLVGSNGTIIDGRTDVAEIWSTTKDYVPTFWEGPFTAQTQDQDKLETGADDHDVTFRDHLLP